MEGEKISNIDPTQIKELVKNDESGNELYEYYDEEYSGSDEEAEVDSIKIIA